MADTASERVRSGESFQLVSMLNVLDRCASPQRLLSAARSLCPGGHLLLATPLPFQATYYGEETQWSGEVLETLPLDGETWEADAEKLIELLQTSSFEPVAISRLPYLCASDAGCIELDDLIVLARVPGAAA